jgi:hypothetical protein
VSCIKRRGLTIPQVFYSRGPVKLLRLPGDFQAGEQPENILL